MSVQVFFVYAKKKNREIEKQFLTFNRIKKTELNIQEFGLI